MNRPYLILAAVAVTGLMAACAATNPPERELTETRMTIEAADNAGGREFAPLEMRQAEQKLELAREAVKKEQYAQAIRLTEHAKADAELAQAKALNAKAQKTVAELRESIRVLQEEIRSKTTNP